MSETDAMNLGGANAHALTRLNPANADPSDKKGMEGDVIAGKESETAERVGAQAPATRRPGGLPDRCHRGSGASSGRLTVKTAPPPG